MKVTLMPLAMAAMFFAIPIVRKYTNWVGAWRATGTPR